MKNRANSFPAGLSRVTLRQRVFGLALLLAALLIPGGGQAQTINWTKYDNTVPAASDGSSTNGKIPLGTATSGDSSNTLYPSVIKDGATYKMWYVGSTGNWFRIYHATSSNGLEWTKYDNTTPTNSDGSSTNGKIPLGTSGRGDASHATTPSVLKDGATYKMWYSGWGPGGYRIYHATSSNGLEWTKFDNNIPENSDGASTNGKIPLGTAGKGDSKYVSYPSVIKDGATYKMWYSAADAIATNWRIYYATSSNGLQWTKLDNGIPENSDGASTNGKIPLGTAGKGDAANAFSPFVFKDNSSYKMWYTGSDGTNSRIYHATSSNGLEWTKYDNTIPAVSDTTNSNSRLGLGSNTKGDDANAGYPMVAPREDGRGYKLWYAGYDGANWRIYYATQPPPAGTIFTFH